MGNTAKTERTQETVRKEIQLLEKCMYRLNMKISNLEYNVSHCHPDDFDGFMYELEEAREQVRKLGVKNVQLKCEMFRMESDT